MFCVLCFGYGFGFWFLFCVLLRFLVFVVCLLLFRFWFCVVFSVFGLLGGFVSVFSIFVFRALFSFQCFWLPFVSVRFFFFLFVISCRDV